MDPELLLQLLSDPETAQLVAQMSGYGDRMGLFGQAGQRADTMRNTPSAQGRQVGNTYVASSPLEHFSVGLNRYMGQKGVDEATAKQHALIDKDIGARERLAKAMLQAMQQGRQPKAPEEPALLNWE